MKKNIYPTVICINNEKITTAFINDLLMYNCDFRLEDIKIKSVNKIKKNVFHIKYQDIDNISLSLCSRISSSGTIGYTMTPCLAYHIDIIVNVKDSTSYIFEIEPTLKILYFIKYIKDLNINLIDKFNIQSLLSHSNNISEFKDYMNDNFENFAKEYHLDNPRKKY